MTVQIIRNRILNQSSLMHSELDVIGTVIEPILELAGWDIRDITEIRRRGPGQTNDPMDKFDIELYIDDKLMIALEAKNIEEKIEKCITGRSGKIFKDNKGRWNKKGNNIAAQLRVYCANRIKNTNDIQPYTRIILTNGRTWIIVNKCIFLRTTLYSQNITAASILQQADISDPEFDVKILDIIDKSYFAPGLRPID